MKVLRYLGFAMALASFSQACFAVEDKSDELWRNFYIKLLTVIRGGDTKEVTKDNQKPDVKIVLQVPGIPLAEMDKESQEDKNYIYSLLDETLQYNPVYTKGKRTFSNVYKDILEYHQSDPGPTLDKADKALLDKAQNDTNPEKSKKMQAYLKYEKEYNDLQMEIAEARLEKNNAKVSSLNSKSNNARRAWESQGFKNLILDAFNTIREKSVNSPGVWWTNLDTSFNDANIGKDESGSPVYGITTYPPYNLWASDTGWLNFTYKVSEKATSSTVRESDRSFGAKMKISFYKAKMSRNSEMKSMKSLASDNTLVISMQIKKVVISRRWFDWHVFVSNKWTWSKGMDSTGRNKVISDGKGGGELPLYTDTIIIVRKVKFKSKSIASMKEQIMKEVKMEASASYGPFSMEGSSRDKSEDEATDDKESAGSISIEEPQIIGYTCTVVPKCPVKTVK
ncbi:MAG: hypothetical protein P4L36_10990 [Holophaga sp.]|nr:hypothetical protein [Holophaga sp.]